MDANSLSHSKWNCKYHIVFAPKFRRKVAYGTIIEFYPANVIPCDSNHSFIFFMSSYSMYAIIGAAKKPFPILIYILYV